MDEPLEGWNGADMTETITLMIDGLESVTVEAGTTLLRAGVRIGKQQSPRSAITRRPQATPCAGSAWWRWKARLLAQPACIVKAAPGMKVQTASERVVRARRTILEMLASTMDLSEAPEILT